MLSARDLLEHLDPDADGQDNAENRQSNGQDRADRSDSLISRALHARAEGRYNRTGRTGLRNASLPSAKGALLYEQQPLWHRRTHTQRNRGRNPT